MSQDPQDNFIKAQVRYISEFNVGWKLPSFEAAFSADLRHVCRKYPSEADSSNRAAALDTSVTPVAAAAPSVQAPSVPKTSDVRELATPLPQESQKARGSTGVTTKVEYREPSAQWHPMSAPLRSHPVQASQAIEAVREPYLQECDSFDTKVTPLSMNEPPRWMITVDFGRIEPRMSFSHCFLLPDSGGDKSWVYSTDKPAKYIVDPEEQNGYRLVPGKWRRGTRLFVGLQQVEGEPGHDSQPRVIAEYVGGTTVFGRLYQTTAWIYPPNAHSPEPYVAGQPFPNTTIGLVSAATEDILSVTGDGTLGLGPKDPEDPTSFLSNAVLQDVIDQPRFFFDFYPDDGRESTFILGNYGTLDDDLNAVYFEVIHPTESKYAYAVALSSVSVGSGAVNVQKDPCVVLDSGAYFLHTSNTFAESFYAQIEGSTQNKITRIHTFKYSRRLGKTTVSLGLGSNKIFIALDSLIYEKMPSEGQIVHGVVQCKGARAENGPVPFVTSDSITIFGMSLLRHFSMFFTKGRVGFGKKRFL